MVDLPENDTSEFLEIPIAGTYIFKVIIRNNTLHLYIYWTTVTSVRYTA